MKNEFEKNLGIARYLKRYSFCALFLSFIVHLGFLGFKIELPKFSKSKKVAQRVIKIKLNPKKKVQKKSGEQKQIVTTENTGKKKENDSRFLSEKTQTYDRQTVSKRIGVFKETGKGIRKGTKKLAQAKKNTKVTKKVAKNQKKKGVIKRTKKISFNDLALGNETPKREKKAEMKRKLAALGLKSGREGLLGLSQNNDFIEDVPLGDVTNLNTVEYKYYGFYHRIKQKLEQYWGNSLRKKAESLYKQGRRIPASENRITSLTITMDNGGNIVDIQINATSGVRELDDAAIESFKRAGPFPNPPKGMMKDGHAQIEWGFVVKG
jgi:TonB family protein